MSNEVSKIYSDIAELLNIARAKAYHTVNSIMVECLSGTSLVPEGHPDMYGS